MGSVPRGFAGRLNSYACSTLFLVGCILFSVGHVIGLFVNFSLGDILVFAIPAVHIVGFWMLYSASQSKDAGASLTSMLFLKIGTIIRMVLFCIAFGLFMAGMLALVVLTLRFARHFARMIPLMLFIFITGGAVGGLVVKFYFLALLKTLKSLRSGIAGYRVKEIQGADTFVVLSFIGIGFNVLGNLAVLATLNSIQEVMGEFTAFIEEFITGIMVGLGREAPTEFGGLVDTVTNALSGISLAPILLNVVGSAGLALIIVCLQKFSRGVKARPMRVQAR